MFRLTSNGRPGRMSGIPRRRQYGHPRTNAIYLRHGTSADARAGIPPDVRARNIRGCPSTEYLRMIHGCSAEVIRISVDVPSRKPYGCPRTDIRGCSAPDLKCVSPRNIRHGTPADIRTRNIRGCPSAEYLRMIHGSRTDIRGCAVTEALRMSAHGHPRMFRAGFKMR